MKKKVRVTRLYLKIKNVIATFYLKMQTFFLSISTLHLPILRKKFRNVR